MKLKFLKQPATISRAGSTLETILRELADTRFFISTLATVLADTPTGATALIHTLPTMGEASDLTFGTFGVLTSPNQVVFDALDDIDAVQSNGRWTFTDPQDTNLNLATAGYDTAARVNMSGFGELLDVFLTGKIMADVRAIMVDQPNQVIKVVRGADPAWDGTPPVLSTLACVSDITRLGQGWGETR